MTALMSAVGPKHTIMIGLFFEMMQLMWYGFGSQQWMMWAAGVLAAVSSISYPSISAFVSMHADADKQGLVQGMITGIRGLCNGLGPAMFGLIFYLFHVDLNEKSAQFDSVDDKKDQQTIDVISELMPGPPFVFGAFLVILALLVAAFIPDSNPTLFSSDEEKVLKKLKEESRVRSWSVKDEGIKFSDNSVTSDSDDEYNIPLIKEEDSL